VHEWTAANPIKSQVIVISRCRVDIPPPTLLVESDVIKVVPKVNTQKVYWILRSLRPHASHTPFEVRR
jgi:hypothetical protein